MRGFLCGKGKDSKGVHLMSWDKVCGEKANGGLGVQILQTFRNAMLGKQVNILVTGEENLWAAINSRLTSTR